MSRHDAGGPVLHQEQTSLTRIGLLMGGSVLAALTIDIVSGFALGGWSIPVAIFGGIAAVTIWSIGYYNQIVLTPDRLTVGTQRFGPLDFDATFGVQTDNALTTAETELIASPGPIPPDASVQLAGRGWAPVFGFSMIVLRASSDGRKTVIATRAPDRLRWLLDDWIGSR